MLAKMIRIAQLVAKIDYWRQRYSFSFQIWSKDELNVYIHRDDAEIHSSGGFDSITDLFQYTVDWCEKHYPRFVYPAGIEITNPQP